jgi:hypothetical protein
MRAVVSIIVTLLVAAVIGLAPATNAQGQPPNPHVVIETSMGNITVELFRSRASVSVVNFLTYA